MKMMITRKTNNEKRIPLRIIVDESIKCIPRIGEMVHIDNTYYTVKDVVYDFDIDSIGVLVD